MYIICIKNNKDYYDGVVGTVGIDKTIVYERNTIEIQDNKKMLKEFQSSRNTGWHGNSNRENHFLNIGYMRTESKKYDDADFFIVGFCGKLYLGWKFEYKVKERDETGMIVEVPKTDIVYGYEKAKKHLKDRFWKSDIENDIKYVLDYEPINMFRILKSPIFIYDNHISKTYLRKNKSTLIVNPILKEYEFYKIMDSFTAFQEIQMFLGGVLGVGEKEIIEVDDKYKIPQHGFDKWNFRKEPSKKK